MWTQLEDDSQQRAAVGSRRSKEKLPPPTKTRFEAVNFYNEEGKGDGRSAAASAVLQQGCVTDRPGRCQILWRLNFIKNSVNATSAVQLLGPGR